MGLNCDSGVENIIIASKLTERAIRVDIVTAMESKNIRGILVCIFIVPFEK